ncbi:MAG: pitrilysin family protein [Parcubacteria group bacterium]
MKHKVLANGLQILLAPRQSAEVTIAVAIKMGDRYEKADMVGIDHICEHLITASGSEHFPTETAFNRALDSFGGEFEGMTSNDIILALITLNKQKFNLGMTLFCDMVLRPIMTDEHIELARSVIVNELKGMLDDGDVQVKEMRDILMFPNNALSQNTAMEAANTKKFKPWQIRRHYKKLVRPNRMIIVVAGDFNQEKALESIEREFGGLKRGHPQSFAPFSVEQTEARIKLLPRRSNQISFSLGFPLWGFDDPRRYPLIFLNNILADRESSILISAMRSESGLVYEIDSAIWQWEDAGYFRIDAYTGKRNQFFQILEMILAKLGCLKSKLINQEEFNLTLDNLKYRAKRSFSDDSYAAKFYAGQIATCGRVISLRP